MSGFTPSATFTDGRNVAGLQAAREKPDRRSGVVITNAKDGFLSLFNENVKGEDGRIKKVKPTIKSESTWSDSPEIWDDEVLPHLFRLTSDVAGCSPGASVTWSLDITSGIETGDVIEHAEDGIQGVVTAIAGLDLTVTITATPGSATVTASGDASNRNLEKLAPSRSDGFAVGTGVTRTKIQRINYLQLMDKPVTIGMVQKNLAIEANDGGDGPGSEERRQIKMAMIDLLKQRDNQMIGSSAATLLNGGTANQRGIAKGLTGWSGATVPNTDPDGALTFEDFVNVHLGAAREAGASTQIYALAGLDVRTTINSFYEKKIRAFNSGSDAEYKGWISKYETPAGTLNLVSSDFMDGETRRGQMITFDPERLCRKFLRNLDFKYLSGLELNNVMGDRSTWLVMEALMATGGHVRVHTNIRKGA